MIQCLVKQTFFFCAVCILGLLTANHGGVKMGKSYGCDDGKTYIEIDWDPKSKSEYTCNESYVEPENTQNTHSFECEKDTSYPGHICINKKINYDGIPVSGSHRPVWAAYGEYTYIPPQRWLHNLEHSAIVMLYHPCANQTEVDQLKSLLSRCVRRHIITPSKLLNQSMPFALLSWGCKMLMPHVDLKASEDFIRKRGHKGPERTYSDGDYDTALIKKARTLKGSGYYDNHICPEKEKEYLEKIQRENNS